MKRSSSTRRMSIVAGLAVMLSCLPGANAAADPAPELRAGLTMLPDSTSVVAASGHSILVDAFDRRLSTDDGKTWQKAAVDMTDIWVEQVSAGKAAFLDYSDYNAVSVLDLATNVKTTYSVPAEAGDVWGRSTETAVVFNRDLDYPFGAFNLATGDLTPLTDEMISSNPPGFDNNDEWEVYVWVGAQGAALETDYILDGKQTVTEIDPLPLDGSSGGEVFRVNGYVPYVGLVGDRVEYVKRVSTNVSLCSRPINGPGETCVLMATLTSASQSVAADRSGDAIRLELNGVEYLWEAGTLNKVTYAGSYAQWQGLGDPARPLLHAGGAIFAVGPNGAASKLFGDLGRTRTPHVLDLSPNRLVGLDVRASAWFRSLTSDAIGGETFHPGISNWLAASAGRLVTGGNSALTFYDRDVKKATAAITGSLADASGPYALVMSKGKGSLRTAAGPVTAASPAAIFGSRYVSVVGTGDEQEAWVRDTASAQQPFELRPNAVFRGTWRPSQTRMWGDWVIFNMDMNQTLPNGEPLYNAHAFPLNGPPTTYEGGSVVSMGDGVAVIYDHNTQRYVLWDYENEAPSPLKAGIAQPVLDDGNHLAYVDGDQLVVTTVAGMGASNPRLLGTVARTSFNPNAGAWKPEFDATKPLAEGTLEISHGTGSDLVVDRVLPVPASSDGSIRGLAWDGKNTAGEWVADGDYTWTLKAAEASDSAKVLVAVDGVSAVSGTVTVKAANLGTVTAVTPKVSDTTPTVDQNLTAVTGAWKPTMVRFGYQWYRDSTAIPGATAASYKVLPSDAGHTVKVKVTGSCPGTDDYCRGYASASKTSSSTAKVARARITPASAPVLDPASPVVDQEIASTIAPWGPDPVSLTYQWYKVNTKGTSSAIGGAKLSTFTPTGAEVGYKLKLKATGTKAGYTTKSVYSTLTGKVAKAAFASVADPTITGSVKLGMPLTAVPGATDKPAKASYQWYRGTTRISGATASTYKTTSSDLGKQLRVLVIYTRSGYVGLSRYSALTDPIEPGLVTLTPKLDDTTPAVGQVLGITEDTGIGAWTPADATPAYQWYRDSTAIAGAMAATYEVQAADLGKTIKVKLTGSKDGYLSVAKTSAPSSRVVTGV